MATFSDDFNRANVNPIGSPYVTEAPYFDLQVSSNTAKGTGAGSAVAHVNTYSPTTNQFAECKINTDANFQGVVIRVDAGAGGTFYFMEVTSLTTIDIYRYNVAAGSLLASRTIASIVLDSTVLRLEAHGAGNIVLIRFFRDGVQQGADILDTNASRILAAGRIGPHAFGAGGAGLDDLNAGDMPTPDGTGLPAFDAASGKAIDSNAAAGFDEWDHILGSGNNRILVVGWNLDFSRASAVTSGVTFNGVAMTLLDTQTIGGFPGNLYFYYMKDVNLPAAGTYKIRVNWSAAHWGAPASAASYSNVDQGNPFGTTGKNSGTSSAPLGPNLYTGLKDRVVSAFGCNQTGTLTPSAYDTERDQKTTTFLMSAVSDQPGDIIMRSQWTLSVPQAYGIISAPLQPFDSTRRMWSKWFKN